MVPVVKVEDATHKNITTSRGSDAYIKTIETYRETSLVEDTTEEAKEINVDEQKKNEEQDIIYYPAAEEDLDSDVARYVVCTNFLTLQ